MFSLGLFNQSKLPAVQHPATLTEVTAKTAELPQSPSPASIFSPRSLETTAVPGFHMEGLSRLSFGNSPSIFSGGGGGGGGSGGSGGGGSITFS